MRIWKYDLPLADLLAVQMPKGARILDIQVQRGVVRLWALCDETAPKVARHISIYGTGNPIPDEPGEYIATFQMHDGDLVFHAFEVIA